jgi:hypothetical protein
MERAMTYKIEKNIPMPNPIRNGVETHKYPFFEMKVGDSFAVPVDPSTQLSYMRVGNRIASAINAQKKRQPKAAFTYRTFKDKREIRVWRTK